MGSASDAQTLHEAMAPHPLKGNLSETNRIRMGPIFSDLAPEIYSLREFIDYQTSMTTY
jgi:hypothetical protein